MKARQLIQQYLQEGQSGLYGRYNEYGYAIYDASDTQASKPLYAAGNDEVDDVHKTPTAKALGHQTTSVDLIAKWCELTGKEMADQRGVPWLGCTQTS
jgi:hypothetical protein